MSYQDTRRSDDDNAAEKAVLNVFLVQSGVEAGQNQVVILWRQTTHHHGGWFAADITAPPVVRYGGLVRMNSAQCGRLMSCNSADGNVMKSEDSAPTVTIITTSEDNILTPA